MKTTTEPTQEQRELLRLAQQSLGIRSNSTTTDDATKAVFEILRLAIVAARDHRCESMLGEIRRLAERCRGEVESINRDVDTETEPIDDDDRPGLVFTLRLQATDGEHGLHRLRDMLRALPDHGLEPVGSIGIEVAPDGNDAP